MEGEFRVGDFLGGSSPGGKYPAVVFREFYGRIYLRTGSSNRTRPMRIAAL